MKRFIVGAALAGLVLSLPAALFADDALKTTHGVWRADDLIGMTVRNDAGEDLGEIKNLVIDTSSGKIRYAAMSFGGFLGLGDKLFAVPWQDLHLVPSSQEDRHPHFLLSVHKEALKNAPGFDKDQWPSFADNNFTDRIDKFYLEHRQAGRPGETQRR